jgi:hypothetical protein
MALPPSRTRNLSHTALSPQRSLLGILPVANMWLVDPVPPELRSPMADYSVPPGPTRPSLHAPLPLMREGRAVLRLECSRAALPTSNPHQRAASSPASGAHDLDCNPRREQPTRATPSWEPPGKRFTPPVPAAEQLGLIPPIFTTSLPVDGELALLVEIACGF